MITGFNTDVEYDGVTYHVQTEDKGLESPLILSLVYSGGAILASKRSPYDDLIAAGFKEQALAERLQRQHKLICAAINAGRLEDLKRMSSVRTAAPAPIQPVQPPATPPPQIVVPPPPPQASAPDLNRAATEHVPVQPSPIEPPPPQPPPADAYRTNAKAPAEVELAGEQTNVRALHLGLLEERELRGGEFVTLRVRLSRGTEESRDAVPDATITLKILGTTFRPVISSARTDRDGIAIVFAALPRFTTGRAAILIRASSEGEEAEMRRIIHPT